MSWLLHSMQPEISRTYLLLPTACGIWMTNYRRWDLRPKSFRLKRQIQKTKQGASSITEYLNILKVLLIELDMYTTLEMESPTDARWVKEMLE